MTAKPGRKLERKANVTVTLPLALLDRIEDLVEQGKAPSRSRLVLDAVERYIRTL